MACGRVVDGQALSVALIAMPPVVVVKPSVVPVMYAATSPPTSLSAIERPIETAIPASPPIAAATLAAPATTWIPALSVAVTLALATEIPVPPSPST